MIAADQAIFRGRFKPFFTNPDGKSMDVTLQGSGCRALTVRLAGRRASRFISMVVVSMFMSSASISRF